MTCFLTLKAKQTLGYSQFASEYSLMNKAREKRDPPSLHALKYNPPQRVAPWSIELTCMQDKEVFL